MTKMHKFQLYCEVAVSKPIVLRAFKVSFFVGSILNLVNQGDTLIEFKFAQLHIFKMLLTYLVPYFVTTYTATAMKIEFQIGTKAIVEADLVCKKCHSEIHIQKNELIPECPTCGIYGKWRLK